MNRNEISVNELIRMKDYSNEFIKNLWYDWFCKDSSLVNRGKVLLSKVRTVSKNTKKFDLKNSYVFFKNNCPCWGDQKLYDDFRICEMNSGNVIYTIIPRNPRGKAEVWGNENKFEKPVVTGTWADIKKFFES